MLAKLAYRFATEVSPRLLAKGAYLCAYKGMRALSAHKRRVRRGELFPPFMLIALTNVCNLRCHGCWIEKGGPARHLPPADLDAMIAAGKRHKAHYFILLGGEPMMYPDVLDICRRHADCYFQIITNGMLFGPDQVRRIRELGNITPLVSIDGLQEANDARRGAGVFGAAVEGMQRLKHEKILFGIATTVTAANVEEVMSDAFVESVIRQGALYLWYYIYRPVGDDPSPHLCLGPEKIVLVRRRLLELRRKHAIVLIDTYWNAAGEALCPAASGLGFHIGPQGSIEPCPPMSFACERIQDNGGDLFRTINESEFLRGFQKFVADRTHGCVILERPAELKEYLQGMGARDFSGRDAYAELAASTPRNSHHLVGEEIPEDYWLYRFLKKQLFFGMGAYG
ncbi:MAG: radical SAM/SPASM domain-containing protein [Pirellulales bacterium]